MARTVFVTGATGFIGAFFTAHLLRQGLPLFALFRSASKRSLEPTIEAVGDLPPGLAKDLLGNLICVEGDVRADNCGLSETDADRIASTVTDIWHFAATFEEGRKGNGDVLATNVGGTDNLLKFMDKITHPVRLNFVSTAYASPVVDNVAYERLGDSGEAKSNEYETTKAEAERRVTAYCSAEGVEYRIFRPPIVAGESSAGLSLGNTGYQGVFRALYLLTRRLEVNIGPGFDRDLRLRVIAEPKLPVNVVPVDFVTEAMWKIAEHDHSAGGIYHITSDHAIELDALFQAASKSLNVSGITLSATHDFEALPVTMAERLFRRRMKFQEPYFLNCNRFDASAFRNLVPESVLPSPLCGPDYLARCNQFCLDSMEREFAEISLEDAERRRSDLWRQDDKFLLKENDRVS